MRFAIGFNRSVVMVNDGNVAGVVALPAQHPEAWYAVFKVSHVVAKYVVWRRVLVSICFICEYIFACNLSKEKSSKNQTLGSETTPGKNFVNQNVENSNRCVRKCNLRFWRFRWRKIFTSKNQNSGSETLSEKNLTIVFFVGWLPLKKCVHPSWKSPGGVSSN